MSWTAIACAVVCLVISFAVIFMAAGVIAPVAASYKVAQLILAAVASLAGLLGGSYVYQTFFRGR